MVKLAGIQSRCTFANDIVNETRKDAIVPAAAVFIYTRNSDLLLSYEVRYQLSTYSDNSVLFFAS